MPFSMDRFEVEFTSPSLSELDRVNLSRCIKSIRPGSIELDLFLDKPHHIIPLDAIQKLQDESGERMSDINISILGDDDAVISTVVYKRCTFAANLLQLLGMMKTDAFGIFFPKTLSVSFEYEKVSLNQKELA